jgi:hypothetical protein
VRAGPGKPFRGRGTEDDPRAFTLGFWSNSNGQAVLQAHDPAWRTLVNSLHLRNANGTPFTVPTTGTFSTVYSTFRTWLLNANATNMAYMLSAQLTAMELNVAYKGISSSQYLYVGPGSAIRTGLNNSQGANLQTNLTSGATTFGLVAPTPLGFIKISDVLSNAISMLTNYGNTVSASAARTYEEALKILLDGANNNLPIYVI